ncbi:MAG: twin-arginine translocase TatA/TatE family subunit [Anaerolineae bacterium]|nr:twin-arginine translocase TatA/TatE family subunit [Anaerolineae bacterium]
MEILGIGGWEIVLIFILLLIVAGPKRMIAWSYTLGRYLAVFRNMWAETAAALQKELRQAGVDVEIPSEPPTRGSINTLITNTVTKLAAPVTDPLKETQKQLGVNDLMGPATPRTLNKPVTTQTPPASAQPVNGTPAPVDPASLGAWTETSQPPAQPVSAPPKHEESGFGSWTGGS